MTDCSIFAIQFPEEKRNITAYMEKLHEVFTYLSELFAAADPLNEKMSVLLGIATYSYKRFKEIYEHQLFNSISGRSCVRVLIEDYIMMKYLVKMRLLMMIFGVTISCMAWAYISWFWQGTGKMVL